MRRIKNGEAKVGVLHNVGTSTLGKLVAMGWVSAIRLEIGSDFSGSAWGPKKIRFRFPELTFRGEVAFAVVNDEFSGDPLCKLVIV